MNKSLVICIVKRDSKVNNPPIIRIHPSNYPLGRNENLGAIIKEKYTEPTHNYFDIPGMSMIFPYFLAFVIYLVS